MIRRLLTALVRRDTHARKGLPPIVLRPDDPVFGSARQAWRDRLPEMSAERQAIREKIDGKVKGHKARSDLKKQMKSAANAELSACVRARKGQ